ncbi:MAG TPA: hypothetical protein VE422_03240, partial [Terriglobia bacterium]|nr:hypothetical protein [Terriglobia bacterium]
SAGSAPAPGLPGQEVREALRLPDFLVRKCGKRSGSRTSWSGSAGSALAPGLPGQEVREALWLPDFPVRKCGKRSGSRTSRSASAASTLPRSRGGARHCLPERVALARIIQKFGHLRRQYRHY